MTNILAAMTMFMLLGLIIIYHEAKRKLHEAEFEERLEDRKKDQQLDYKNQFYLIKVKFEKNMEEYFRSTEYVDCAVEAEKVKVYLKTMEDYYNKINLPIEKEKMGNELIKMVENLKILTPCFDANRFPLSDVFTLGKYGIINQSFLDAEKKLTTYLSASKIDTWEKKLNEVLEKKDYQNMWSNFSFLDISNIKAMLWVFAHGTVGTKEDYQRVKSLFLRLHKKVHIDTVTSELYLAWNTGDREFVRKKVLRLIGIEKSTNSGELLEKKMFENNPEKYYELLAYTLNLMHAEEYETMVLRHMKERNFSMSSSAKKRLENLLSGKERKEKVDDKKIRVKDLVEKKDYKNIDWIVVAPKDEWLDAELAGVGGQGKWDTLLASISSENGELIYPEDYDQSKCSLRKDCIVKNSYEWGESGLTIRTEGVLSYRRSAIIYGVFPTFNYGACAPRKMVTAYRKTENFEREELKSKTTVLEYLKSCEVLGKSRSGVYDSVKKIITSHTMYYYTDEEYEWDSWTIYHLEHYNLKIKDEFVAKVETLSERLLRKEKVSNVKHESIAKGLKIEAVKTYHNDKTFEKHYRLTNTVQTNHIQEIIAFFEKKNTVLTVCHCQSFDNDNHPMYRCYRSKTELADLKNYSSPHIDFSMDFNDLQKGTYAFSVCMHINSDVIVYVEDKKKKDQSAKINQSPVFV